MWRSIGAVAVGFLLAVVLAFGVEFALLTLFHREPINDYDRESLLLILLLFTTNTSVAVGGYTAGVVAGRWPLGHALVLGFLGLLVSFPPTLAQWRNEPVWYHAAALLLIVPAAAVGGWVCARQQAVA